MNIPLAVIPFSFPLLNKASDDFFMSMRERSILAGLLNDVKARTVVEVGIQRGQCARVLLENVPTIESYFGIDVEADYVTSVPAQQTEIPDVAAELVRSDPRVTLCIRPSGSLDLAPNEIPRCDVMIIDGDHGEAAVRHDSQLAFARVRVGGLILWHDYWPEFEGSSVVRVINELYENGYAIRHIPETWLAICRL